MTASRSSLQSTSALRRLAQDESGAAAVLFAIALPALVGLSAMIVDLGSLYLSERRLQNLADAAAAAAATSGGGAEGAAAVADLLADAGLSRVEVAELTDGQYTRDRDIAWDERFDPTAAYHNAAKVVLRQEVPLFFGSLLTGSNTSSVVAQATAARMDLAGFRLGTRVASLDAGLANGALSALAGTQLGLDSADLGALVGTQIDVLDFAAELGQLNGHPDATFGEIFDGDTTLAQAVQAMANAAPTPETSALLGDVAGVASGEYLTVSDMIDLGPLKPTDINDGHANVSVDAYSLLRAMLQASHGDSYKVSFTTSVAGLASTTVHLAGGYGEEVSPWLSVDTASGVTLRTAETRIYVQVRTNQVPGLPVGLNIPLYTELASAEAQMTDINCSSGDGTEGVDVSATPSLGDLAIASINTNAMENFTSPMALSPAALVHTGVLDVNAYANIEMGGGQAETLHFSLAEIAAKTSKSAGTSNLVEGVASSLVDEVELQVRLLGLGLGLGSTTVQNTVASQLLLLAPTLDTVVNSLTNVLGVKLGVADVTVDRIRCGRPTMVG
ncbi:MAG: pilus assembly protein TadG-related protein [Alteraurantiacibacter sp.]